MEELLIKSNVQDNEGYEDNPTNWLITQPEELEEEWFSMGQFNLVCSLCR